MKSLRADLEAGEKKVEELIDEIDATVKEVDKVLLGCEINSAE